MDAATAEGAMSVTNMVSGSGILELEKQAVSSFQGATKSMATALEVLWAIKKATSGKST